MIGMKKKTDKSNERYKALYWYTFFDYKSYCNGVHDGFHRKHADPPCRLQKAFAYTPQAHTTALLNSV